MAEQMDLPMEEADQQAQQPTLNANSSLRAVMATFETYMEDEDFAENTRKAFVSDLEILQEYVGVGTAIGDISTQNLNNFAKWLVEGRGVPCSPKSLARRITTLKVFFGWLAETDVLDKDPAAAVIHKPAVSPLPTVLTDAEVERVLNITQGMRHGEEPDARPHLLITLLLHTGIKKGECMNIVMNHFDFSDPARPILWIRYANPRRRHKERKLRLPSWWSSVLAEYRAQYKPEQALFPWTARNMEYVLKDVAEAADLPHNLSFEMLRWTCAVRDFRDGMDETDLRHKLGISKITWREVKVKLQRLAQSAL